MYDMGDRMGSEKELMIDDECEARAFFCNTPCFAGYIYLRG